MLYIYSLFVPAWYVMWRPLPLPQILNIQPYILSNIYTDISVCFKGMSTQIMTVVVYLIFRIMQCCCAWRAEGKINSELWMRYSGFSGLHYRHKVVKVLSYPLFHVKLLEIKFLNWSVFCVRHIHCLTLTMHLFIPTLQAELIQLLPC